MIARISMMVVFGCATAFTAGAQYLPSWWLDPSNPVIVLSTASNGSAPVNAGQLKWIALRAKVHLDAALPGGAGTAVSNLVAAFSSTNNFVPINLGQLKAVALPFYDRLNSAGYSTKLNLRANGYPQSWTGDYPWDPNTPTAANYKPVTIGQLKLVFSFDVVDSDQNGTLDYQEGIYPAASSTRDSDGDGIPDIYDAYPNDPSRAVVLVNDPNDHTPPTITVSKPTGVTLVP